MMWIHPLVSVLAASWGKKDSILMSIYTLFLVLYILVFSWLHKMLEYIWFNKMVVINYLYEKKRKKKSGMGWIWAPHAKSAWDSVVSTTCIYLVPYQCYHFTFAIRTVFILKSTHIDGFISCFFLILSQNIKVHFF